jgi:DNA-binding CsgD family transcriptional regulator
MLAERSLAFEDAAAWFERAAGLPDCDPSVREQMLLAAGADYVRACQFSRARGIYERLAASAAPEARLFAAMGFEDATWRPGRDGSRAADLLSIAMQECDFPENDPRYLRALGSLGRALALAGETDRARQVGGRAITIARAVGDETTLGHALVTSLWHGTTPDMAGVQKERTSEVYAMATKRRDFEMLGAAVNFHAMVSYLCGFPDEFEQAVPDSRRAAEATGQPYLRYVHCCLAHAEAFLRGDLEGAQRWSEQTLEANATFDEDITEGPQSVQMFMIRRAAGALGWLRPHLDGRETFKGRWVPGLLAIYTELGVEQGIRRALQHLMDRDLGVHINEAQWPLELVFMTEGALAIRDRDAARLLRPLLGAYSGKNLFSGTLIATFGSTERYLGDVAALLGDSEAAEECFAAALEMDRRMRSVVHTAETLARHALFAASLGQAERSRELARKARDLAEPIGLGRVLAALAPIGEAAGPEGLTERELEVLRLLAAGLSNQEIGARLYISSNTAANHVRSILMKTGSANRTQAAMYAAQHLMV